MKRKIYQQLLDWKARDSKKVAILIDGARRVGKSWVAEEFGKNEYESYLLRIAIRQPKLFADVVSEDYPEMIRSRRFGGGADSGVSLLLYLFCAFVTYFAGGGML